MKSLPRRTVATVLCALIALAFSVTLSPEDAEAQMERRSGAGEMKQAGGAERRGNTNRSSTRGQSRMSSTRTPSRGLDEDDFEYDEDEDEEDDDGRSYGNSRKSKKKSSRDEDEEEEEEEDVDYGSRTLGRACMYGARGEVIFRPEGSLCRGDVPVASESAEARKHRRDRRAGKPRGASIGRTKNRVKSGEASPSSPAARDTRSRPKRSKPKARGGPCMYDGKGKVIYAPAGSSCRDR